MLYLTIYFQKSTDSSASYKAAVAEFHRSDNGTFDERILDNLSGYKKLIDEARQQVNDLNIYNFYDTNVRARKLFTQVFITQNILMFSSKELENHNNKLDQIPNKLTQSDKYCLSFLMSFIFFQEVDILVFPEATLNYYSIPGNGSDDDRKMALEYATFVPDPAAKIAPCDLDENNNQAENNDTVIVYRY